MSADLVTQASHLPTIDISSFDGPLALLSHLIDRNRFNWFDIPIADITRQYLAILKQAEDLNMELAGEFLVMGATLIQIKSRLLLPDHRLDSDRELDDPRHELILQLLEYRRCKWLAGRLEAMRKAYDHSYVKPRATAKALDIQLKLEVVDEAERAGIIREPFFRALAALNQRNSERYQDLSEKMLHLLKRDQVSLPEKIRFIFRAVCRRSRLFFSDLFGKGCKPAERVTGFIALLELVRRQYVRVEQTEPFAPMLISSGDRSAEDTDELKVFLKETAHEYD